MKPHAPLSVLYMMNESKQVRPATIYKEWKLAFMKTDRTVLRNVFGEGVVHTFFTGYNLNPDPDGPPLVFQTVVTGVKYPTVHYYATWKEAFHGHALALALLGELAGGGMRIRPLLVGIDGGKRRRPARAAQQDLTEYEPLRSNE